ncbi:hypothetical protein A2U01_0103769, partial [Trifolium medium]|nr:hypothetical protein [Trifolium medium]
GGHKLAGTQSDSRPEEVCRKKDRTRMKFMVKRGWSELSMDDGEEMNKARGGEKQKCGTLE